MERFFSGRKIVIFGLKMQFYMTVFSQSGLIIFSCLVGAGITVFAKMKTSRLKVFHDFSNRGSAHVPWRSKGGRLFANWEINRVLMLQELESF